MSDPAFQFIVLAMLLLLFMQTESATTNVFFVRLLTAVFGAIAMTWLNWGFR